MSSPGDRRTPSLETVKTLVAEAKNTQYGADLLMEVLQEELDSAVHMHDKMRDKTSDIIDLYAQIREKLSPEEKSAFFIAMLDTFRGMNDTRKMQLRAIVRTHIQRVTELHNHKR